MGLRGNNIFRRGKKKKTKINFFIKGKEKKKKK